jgi:hypothetical protein
MCGPPDAAQIVESPDAYDQERLAPQYWGGNRKTVNFHKAGFLAADVDAGMTLDDARSF